MCSSENKFLIKNNNIKQDKLYVIYYPFLAGE